MNAVFLIFGLAVVLLVVMYFLRQKNKVVADLPENLYKGIKFMSKDKIELHKRLVRLLPQEDYIIFTNVSTTSLLAPNVSKEHKDYLKIKESYSSKLIDFVITNKDYQVYFLIELEEQQGETNKDQKIFNILKKAGYKVVIWNAKTLPSNKEIQLKITGKFDQNEESNGFM